MKKKIESIKKDRYFLIDDPIDFILKNLTLQTISIS